MSAAGRATAASDASRCKRAPERHDSLRQRDGQRENQGIVAEFDDHSLPYSRAPRRASGPESQADPAKLRQISISVPISTACRVGTRNQTALRSELCCTKTNSTSRQCAIAVGWADGMIVSRPTM